MTGPRPLPLGFRHLFTNGMCARFAQAMLLHPAAAGAKVMDLVTTDLRLRQEEAAATNNPVRAELYYHTFLRLPDGRCLDATGCGDLATMCRSFGLDPATCLTHPTSRGANWDSRACQERAALVHRLVDLHGWSGSLPDALPLADYPTGQAAMMELVEAAGRHFGHRRGASTEEMLTAALATMEASPPPAADLDGSGVAAPAPAV